MWRWLKMTCLLLSFLSQNGHNNCLNGALLSGFLNAVGFEMRVFTEREWEDANCSWKTETLSRHFQGPQSLHLKFRITLNWEQDSLGIPFLFDFVQVCWIEDLSNCKTSENARRSEEKRFLRNKRLFESAVIFTDSDASLCLKLHSWPRSSRLPVFFCCSCFVHRIWCKNSALYPWWRFHVKIGRVYDFVNDSFAQWVPVLEIYHVFERQM